MTVPPPEDLSEASDSDLAADQRLVDFLRETGFQGERFERASRKLLTQLAEYAEPVLAQWIHDGFIFRKCLQYPGRISPEAREASRSWSRQDREDVVVDSITAGWRFFLDYGLRGGRWAARHGASLATYFVGACVCAFIKVCNDRWRQQVRHEAVVLSDELSGGEGFGRWLWPTGSDQVDPCLLACVRDEATRVLAGVEDPQVRHVLLARMGGLTQAEAARQAGLTEKAAERRLHTLRRRIRAVSNSEEERMT